MCRTSTGQCSEGSWKDGKAPFLPHKSEWSNSFSSFHTWYLPQLDIKSSQPQKGDTAFLPGVSPPGHKLSSHALNAQELPPPALDFLLWRWFTGSLPQTISHQHLPKYIRVLRTLSNGGVRSGA